MTDERRFISAIPEAGSKTFVDLGAGHGRAAGFLSDLAGDVIAIEINPDMHAELERTAVQLPNVTAVNGDILSLPEHLPEGLEQPVFLVLQNGLGTIEGGDHNDVLKVVTSEAGLRRGQLVLSVLRQPVLSGWGVDFYEKISKMTGKVDASKTNFETGHMITVTGYESKWWTDAEIANFRTLGRLSREHTEPEYSLLQLDF